MKILIDLQDSETVAIVPNTMTLREAVREHLRRGGWLDKEYFNDGTGVSLTGEQYANVGEMEGDFELREVPIYNA